MDNIISLEKLNQEYLKQLEDLEEFRETVDYLRKYSRFLDPEVNLPLLNLAIERSEQLGDYQSLVDLYYTKQTLIFGRMEKFPEVLGILSRMEKYSSELDYLEGKALTAIVTWQVKAD